ncbi:hypothetical protein LX32DRAFT_645620 [Colletotrichum zoysiae]|uniref:Uncharacterized protein n=1 Tax=Colletotrichum zoysiae TaxID=1216348 RepID=A0AAD9LV51_9PEZI|nr:hypothetical protein LX32DRAFT_645620 [Colletotrichum zoysiae]
MSTEFHPTPESHITVLDEQTGPNADKVLTRIRSPMASLSRHPMVPFRSYRTRRVCRVQGEKSCPHSGAVAVARLTAIEAVSTIPPPPTVLSIPCILPTYHFSAAPLFCFLLSHSRVPPPMMRPNLHTAPRPPGSVPTTAAVRISMLVQLAPSIALSRPPRFSPGDESTC